MPPVAEHVKGSSNVSGGTPKWRAKVCPRSVTPFRQKRWGLKKSERARYAEYAATFT